MCFEARSLLSHRRWQFFQAHGRWSLFECPTLILYIAHTTEQVIGEQLSRRTWIGRRSSEIEIWSCMVIFPWHIVFYVDMYGLLGPIIVTDIGAGTDHLTCQRYSPFSTYRQMYCTRICTDNRYRYVHLKRPSLSGDRPLLPLLILTPP